MRAVYITLYLFVDNSVVSLIISQTVLVLIKNIRKMIENVQKMFNFFITIEK